MVFVVVLVLILLVLAIVYGVRYRQWWLVILAGVVLLAIVVFEIAMEIVIVVLDE